MAPPGSPLGTSASSFRPSQSLTSFGTSSRSGGLCWAGVASLHRLNPARGPPLSKSGLLHCYKVPEESRDVPEEASPAKFTVPRCAEFNGDYTITLYRDGDKTVGISKTGQALTVNNDPRSLIADWNRRGIEARKPKKTDRLAKGGGFQYGDIVVAKCSKSALVQYGEERIKPVKGQGKEGLVQQINELKNLYPDVKQAWYAYCDQNGETKFQPSAHKQKFLKWFVESLPPKKLKKTCIIVRGESGTVVGPVEPWEDQGWQKNSMWRVDFPKFPNALVSSDEVWQILPGSKHVAEFDVLVEVNGVKGDLDEMLEELENAEEELTLKLRKIPRELGTLRKVSATLRHKLYQEEMDALDFHGGTGDIAGLRAYLAHRCGCAARGWRKEVASLQDERGIRPVTKGEFGMAMANIGFPGQAMTLWHALTDDKHHDRLRAGLEDLEPMLAEKLDVLCKGLRKRFPGGAEEAWEELEREHMCRATFEEFSYLVVERKMVPKACQGENTLWKCFEALDKDNTGNLTLEDLRFLDHWAVHRYGAPLPVRLEE